MFMILPVAWTVDRVATKQRSARVIPFVPATYPVSAIKSFAHPSTSCNLAYFSFSIVASSVKSPFNQAYIQKHPSMKKYKNVI